MLVNIEKDSEDSVQSSSTETTSHANGSKLEEKSSVLTVTQIPQQVFVDEKSKKLFEETFMKYGEISVIYLKSFSRARVVYKSGEQAATAKVALHESLFQESELGVYFTQVPHIPEIIQSTSTNLQPPPPVKQFLISPPTSPPVGWEPVTEGSPIINHELLAAVAQLHPDKPYEAHPPSQAHPSIMVHWCEDASNKSKKDHPLCNLPRHMVQTRKPNT